MGILGRLNNVEKDKNIENSNKDNEDTTVIIVKEQPEIKQIGKYSEAEIELKNRAQKRILEELKNEKNIEALEVKIESIVISTMKKDPEYFRGANLQKITRDLINDVTGYGPITPLLQDPEVSEVMVNGPDLVYMEKKGKIQLTDIRFRDNDAVMHVIDKIVVPIGRRIDENSPMVDARLPDGSRVNAIIPPLSLNGPILTIRKFSREMLTVNDLVNLGTLNESMAIFLEACVKARLNIFISGSTSSGKTTLLNALSLFIPQDERIITIEDSAELKLSQTHVISLEARPANIEGRGEVTIRDLVRNSLRMRPDRLVVGEIRGGEALDMLQAMNTGHDGSLATGHANSPRDMLARIETMVLMSGVDLPVVAIRSQIAGSIDIIIHQSRLKDGSRKIVNISEVQGMEENIIVLQDIFTFKQQGVDHNGKIIGSLKSTGMTPKFYEKFHSLGVDIPSAIFNEEEWADE